MMWFREEPAYILARTRDDPEYWLELTRVMRSLGRPAPPRRYTHRIARPLYTQATVGAIGLALAVVLVAAYLLNA